jgi:S-adenosylmethionine:tRNA ribosyltransferase-isomerase
LLVFNDTRVRKCRFYAHTNHGREHEIVFQGLPDQDGMVRGIISKRKKLRKGDDFQLPEKVILRFEREAGPGALFRVSGNMDEKFFDKYGALPIPPYLHRRATQLDEERYQTVFAAKQGAQASPTAALHFSEGLLASLKDAGIDSAFVTLYVGFGTFLPVRVEDIRRHTMHQESFEISLESFAKIMAHREKKGRIIPVGTTSLRVLESIYQAGFTGPGIVPKELSGQKEIFSKGENQLIGSEAFYSRGKVSWEMKEDTLQGETGIFIYPGYEFKMADALITNFHTPKSSLLLLVSAFYSRAGILHSYAEAIKQDYRFFSYGDAMFLD